MQGRTRACGMTGHSVRTHHHDALEKELVRLRIAADLRDTDLEPYSIDDRVLPALEGGAEVNVHRVPAPVLRTAGGC